MKNILFIVLFSCLIAVGAAENYNTLFASARKAERAKKTEQAIELYTKAANAAQKPADKFAAVRKAAQLLIRTRKKPEALKMLLNFAQDEKNPKVNRTMAYADCFRAAGDAAEKIKLADAGIALSSGGAPEAACHNEKAAQLAAQKKFDQAVEEYKKVAENESYHIISRSVSYMGLASVAARRKDFKEAHSCYQIIQNFSKKNPKFYSADALKAEAALYNQEGKFDEGMKIYLAIAKNPKLSARDREKALTEVIETEYNRRNDPEAAKKMLKETENLKVKRSSRIRRIENDIKYLFDEE